MRVAVDHCCSLDATITLQQTNRDRDIVEQTEAFAVIVEGVVKTAADISCDTARRWFDRGTSGGDRAAGHESQLLHDAH